MMKAKKRFQSGAEIFDMYVPNYEREGLHTDDNAAEFVESVLDEFQASINASLNKKKGRTKKAKK